MRQEFKGRDLLYNIRISVFLKKTTIGKHSGSSQEAALRGHTATFGISSWLIGKQWFDFVFISNKYVMVMLQFKEKELFNSVSFQDICEALHKIMEILFFWWWGGGGAFKIKTQFNYILIDFILNPLSIIKVKCNKILA